MRRCSLITNSMPASSRDANRQASVARSTQMRSASGREHAGAAHHHRVHQVGRGRLTIELSTGGKVVKDCTCRIRQGAHRVSDVEHKHLSARVAAELRRDHCEQHGLS